MDCTVVIGTFGDRSWVELAHERAIPSAKAQGVPVIHRHRERLALARNTGLAAVETPWVVFLDADDELGDGYVETLLSGSADLRAPAVQYVRRGRPRPPYVPRVAGHTHACTGECLEDGNWLVVGTMMPTRFLLDIGGWREWECYEDWDVFLRCWRGGATVEAIPDAIYRAHVRSDSRNRAPDMAVKNEVHRQIVEANA